MRQTRRLAAAALLFAVVGCDQESPTELGAGAAPQLAKIAGAAQGGMPMTAALLGASEVPGPGDADGSGGALVTFNQGQGQVCFELSSSGIATPTRAHIHRGAAGASGGIVVAFFDFVAPPPERGCVTVNADLLKEIRKNPEAFYVNVHNSEFPGGAIRGQLEK